MTQYQQFLVKVAMVLLSMIFTGINYAEGTIKIGKTYPIIEDDLLAFIQGEVKKMNDSGEWQKIQAKAINYVKKKIIRPAPVKSISKADHDREWNYDPSIQLSFALFDHEGRTFAKKGDVVNPLSIMPLRSTLLFIDGDDESQVEFARQTIEMKKNTKCILVNGSIVEVNKVLKIPIYFDQLGSLTNKFSIRHVPAMVYQEELHLKIKEVNL